MSKLAAALKAILAKFNEAINAELKKLPPAEQFDANSELFGARKSIEWNMSRLIENLGIIEGKFTSAEAEAITEITAEVRKALEASGDFIAKAAHEAAITAAASKAKEDERTAITAETQRKEKVSAARAKLAKEAEIPTVICEKLGDDLLLGEPLALEVAGRKLKARVDECAKLRLTVENSAEFVAAACSLPLDEAGDKAFEHQLAPVRSALAVSSSAESNKGKQQTQQQQANPLAGAGNTTPAGATTTGGESWTRFV